MSYHIGETSLSGAFPIMDRDTLVGWFNQSGNDADEGVANAKLFAAAPDLLAACQKAMAWMQARGHDYSDFADEYDALQAAIAKAQSLNKNDSRLLRTEPQKRNEYTMKGNYNE